VPLTKTSTLQSKSEFLKKKEVIDIAAALRIEASPNSGVMEDEVSTRTAMERRHYRKLLSALEASTSQMLATIFSRASAPVYRFVGNKD
jgi:hypothetical protein